MVVGGGTTAGQTARPHFTQGYISASAGHLGHLAVFVIDMMWSACCKSKPCTPPFISMSFPFSCLSVGTAEMRNTCGDDLHPDF